MSIRPYFLPFNHVGSTYEFPHLEPWLLKCESPKGGFTMGIRVRYTSHCWTEAYDEEKHQGFERIKDGIRGRAFSLERYELSKKLGEILQALPDAQVQQTFERRNYVYYAVLADLPQGPYAIYFKIEKARHGPQNLEMMIESAYPNADVQLKVAKRPHAVRFKVLAYRTHMGLPLTFAAR